MAWQTVRVPHCPSPRRRLTDRLLHAFHEACDEGEVEVALALLTSLVKHVEQPPYLPAGFERRAVMRFMAAHERLRNLVLMRGGGEAPR